MRRQSLARSLVLTCAAFAAACVIASPSALAQAPGERSAVTPSDCDYGCLIGFVRGYMSALAKKDPTAVRFTRDVRFTENNVEIPIGDGLWGTITGVPSAALEAADTTTGQAAWLGYVEEHGLPVYYGMRMKVQGRAIAEVETIVVRTTGLPLPFGDVKKLAHDKSFTEVLPPESRRSRERLTAVADSYFNTVELNDGVVFAPFHDDCSRIENGIFTTKAAPGSAGSASSVAEGCVAQFKLGIYRINKRIRERRYPLVDVERGVVVATGFFDHANEFDRYTLTDGKEMKTLLKWPNSISLVEAFKIVDGRIYAIEAVFTYVPYFMHSPFWSTQPLPPAPRQASAVAPACDRTCLVGFADRYMDHLVKRDPKGLPWADHVRFTENSVSMNIGEGQWGSIRKKTSTPLYAADPLTGNVMWLGVIEDHDAPAYFAARLKVEGGKISEVETVAARARNPGPFGDTTKFRNDPLFTQALAPAERRSRERLTAVVDSYQTTKQQNDGTIFTQFDPACARNENGMSVTHGDGGPAVIAKGAAAIAEGCEAQLKLGLYKPVDRMRDRRYPLIDEERGIVVAVSFADHSLRETRYQTTDGETRETQDKYPSSRELFEVFKLRDGKIQRIEALSVFQPYRMPSPWMQ